MAKIGIMGGTFDPIHNGHLILGKQAYQEYQLDEVWYMPSGNPPHKQDHSVTSAHIRCEMTQLAIRNFTGFHLSEFEVGRLGNTYTAHTLKILKNMYSQHQFYFIVGADSLYEIETWHDPSQVMLQATLLAADRDYKGAKRSIEEQIRYLSDKYHADIRILHCPEIRISSAEIRQMCSDGKSIDRYVPEKVAQYIAAHRLYGWKG